MTYLKTRLSVMMFVQYVIWGAWYVTLNTYLTSTLKFSGTEAGAVFGTTAIASLVAPFLVGLLADRWFATERVMATLYVLCAGFLLLATQMTAFVPMFVVMLAVCLCYFPTIALTNAITMQQVADPGSDFPRIRMLGTIGWIAIGLVVGGMGIEASATPFVLGAAACVVMAAYSLFALPHTPPKATGQR
jgi:nucleoside transporter